jgi:hypothetical protein
MPQATEQNTPKDWPIGDLEPAIRGLRNTIGIMEHLTSSENVVEAGEWITLADVMTSYAKQIETIWAAAFEQHIAIHEAHRVALAAAKAEKAAPGSPADVASARALWRMIGTIMKNALEAADEEDAKYREAQS